MFVVNGKGREIGRQGILWILPFPNRVAACGALGVIAEPRESWPLNAQGLPEMPAWSSTRNGFCYLHWGVPILLMQHM